MILYCPIYSKRIERIQMFIIEGSNVFIHVQKVFANDVVHRRVVSNNGGIERHLLRDGFT